jgi:hypothetical protein
MIAAIVISIAVITTTNIIAGITAIIAAITTVMATSIAAAIIAAGITGITAVMATTLWDLDIQSTASSLESGSKAKWKAASCLPSTA